MVTTGQRIKAARKAANMTQGDVAFKMRVTGDCISKWERGFRDPKYNTLCRIADSLGVDVSNLLPGSEDVACVVRCKDCIQMLEKGWCSLHSTPMTRNDFCSYGERRSNHG